MRDVPYYKPPTEGPIFPEDAEGLGDEFSGFLIASDRDVSDAVSRQNIRDKAADSFSLWLAEQTEESADITEDGEH